MNGNNHTHTGRSLLPLETYSYVRTMKDELEELSGLGREDGGDLEQISVRNNAIVWNRARREREVKGKVSVILSRKR